MNGEGTHFVHVYLNAIHALNEINIRLIIDGKLPQLLIAASLNSVTPAKFWSSYCSSIPVQQFLSSVKYNILHNANLCWRYICRDTYLLPYVINYRRQFLDDNFFSVSTPPLCALWECQSQAGIKKEGDANRLCYHTVSLNYN